MDDYGNEVHVIRVQAGKFAIVDGDGGSSPAKGLTALAAYDQAAYYKANGDGPDDEPMTYGTPKEAAEAHLRRAAWERPCQGIHDIRTAGECIADLERRLGTAEAQIALLLAKVAALETENIGLRTNIANMEHRCTCTHSGGAR